MSRRDPNFKPIPAPKRTPRPAPPLSDAAPTTAEVNKVRAILRRALLDQRWDDQGGYSSRQDGKWLFASSSVGQFTPKEMDMLFAFAGVTPDEIEIVGDCAECANSHDGRERGYAAPCSSCLRPSHINHFVPIAKVKKRAS